MLEADHRVTHRDFAQLDVAARYADDAAWEVEDGPVIAYVVNHDYQVVHRGGRRASSER